MRFVAVKTEQQQAALVSRTRDLAVKQRTQLGNAIRGRLAEYGWVAPKGSAHLAILADLLDGGEIGETLPEAARPMFGLGLVPRQASTGGKQKLGAISKMGERTLRRLLIIGASAVVLQASKRGHQRARSWKACWRGSRACWSRSRSPTRWHAPSGRR